MEGPGKYVIETSFSRVEVEIRQVGQDLLILVQGGDRPHIGCTVMAVPRPSLSGDGSVSCTSSVWNLPGHKDEAICRLLAEVWCKETGKVVVCTGGFHVENIRPAQIEELIRRLEAFAGR